MKQAEVSNELIKITLEKWNAWTIAHNNPWKGNEKPDREMQGRMSTVSKADANSQ